MTDKKALPLAMTFAVPDIPDYELRILSVCRQALDQLRERKSPYSALRVAKYLVEWLQANEGIE